MRPAPLQELSGPTRQPGLFYVKDPEAGSEAEEARPGGQGRLAVQLQHADALVRIVESERAAVRVGGPIQASSHPEQAAVLLYQDLAR